jgi:hypothetical protein
LVAVTHRRRVNAVEAEKENEICEDAKVTGTDPSDRPVYRRPFFGRAVVLDREI